MHHLRALVLSICAVSTLMAAKPDPAAVERGRKEFVQLCGFCHGNDATGSRAPDLIRSPLLSHDESGETIGPVIRNGRPDKEMPAFPNANVSDIAAFLHAQALAALNSARVPRDYPVEKLRTGNAAAGKAFFDVNCTGCHSVEGDLKGVGKKYSPIDLQSRFLYPVGQKARPTAKVTLASSEQTSGIIAHLDEFTVALTTADGWYRSYPRGAIKLEVKDPLAGHRQLLYKYTDKDVHNIFTYLESLK
jgi:cytochrome c oxidase cbb3-type subunit III